MTKTTKFCLFLATWGIAVKSIEVLLKYDESISNESLINIRKENGRVMLIVVHSSPNDLVLTENHHGVKLFHLQYKKSQILDHTFCGSISTNSFSVNTKMFSESQKRNSCLNKKIAIDVNGNIKNCPSMNLCFANIKEASLQSVFNNPDFKKNWYITKDQVDICKVCEFRYICVDCRAFTKNGDLHSKPKKCSYNPFTMKWEY